ncbi:apoptosis-enhancing nuclease-like [Phoenix dactylifera]|uniref:RNA exonuclease 4 n=1 Tax=Phoenix dactylifera TaxID=42345 RepID=A0A8B9B3K5_PHODC|nr:apoptosis-enhancing nuclease-like [Phoenix dactylifera]
MDSRPESSETLRNKCAACFRQYNKMEHLVEHMRVSFHSVHEPKCGVCQKHCRSFESLREHLIGPLPKLECARIFSIRGCTLCLNIFDSSSALRIHRGHCQLSRAAPNINISLSRLSLQSSSSDHDARLQGPRVVALGCKLVGGGSDGSLDLCARVCLIGEHENVIFHTYVRPQIPVTNYRYETTGIRPEHLRDAMPLKQAQRRVQDLLCNGEPIWKIRSRGGRARILVGHGLDHDLECLGIDQYPSFMMRDTANYPPLMKTSKLSNSLKYLTQAYLGYDIQTGIQDPYEDCVAAMRLYVRMRSQAHPHDYSSGSGEAQSRNNFPSWRQRELERMTPDQLLELSGSDYYCWCLDS